MRTARVIAFFAIAIVIVSGADTLLVNAQTQITTCDQGDFRQTDPKGNLIFAYDVQESFETEPLGGWINGNTYHLNWTIRLDYINPVFLNDSNYFIQFSLPKQIDNCPGLQIQADNNQTLLNAAHKAGTLNATYKPSNLTSYYSVVKIPFTVLINGAMLQNDWSTGIWQQESGFSTNVMNNQVTPKPATSSLAFPTVPAIIVAIAISLVSVAFIGLRRFKKMIEASI